MSSHKKPFIIGITGAFGSGKSTAAQFFEKKGFVQITLSTFLEEEAHKRQIPITRKILQDIGNEWREKYGKAILAKLALGKIEKERFQKVIVDGIRNVGEIEALRKNNIFVLLALVADRKIRFERLMRIKRREELTWELFTQLDYRDLGIVNTEKGLQVASCIALADTYIENNVGEEIFIKRLQDFVDKHMYE